ncbi:MAG: hypothetical protein ACK5B6_13170 [Bacteroidia bacterium]
MRVIDTIPHPQLRMSIFEMNAKYLVKFEAGPYEQTYKIDSADCGGLEALKSLINDSLLVEVAACFRKMHEINPWKNT